MEMQLLDEVVAGFSFCGGRLAAKNSLLSKSFLIFVGSICVLYELWRGLILLFDLFGSAATGVLALFDS
jgi:hypothetical protein